MPSTHFDKVFLMANQLVFRIRKYVKKQLFFPEILKFLFIDSRYVASY